LRKAAIEISACAIIEAGEIPDRLSNDLFHRSGSDSHGDYSWNEPMLALSNREDKLIAPLTRKKKDGTPYTRPDNVEALLAVLNDLPREALLERAQIRDRKNPSYLPSECLVHLIRASRAENSEAWFERLYKVLADRVMRAVPAAASSSAASATDERIRDAVFDRFVELLAKDRIESDDRLDFFEARFDLAIKRLRLDAQERVWREANRSDSMDEEGSDAADVAASATTNPLDAEIFFDPLFRERLYVAIDALPPEQRRTMHLLLIGWQIHSSDPSVMTIAKALGCSDRSVRNYRDRALKTLGALFNPGDDE
jgi:DNA-directed RNA polymerase specialized sigma24 family protein